MLRACLTSTCIGVRDKPTITAASLRPTRQLALLGVDDAVFVADVFFLHVFPLTSSRGYNVITPFRNRNPRFGNTPLRICAWSRFNTN